MTFFTPRFCKIAAACIISVSVKIFLPINSSVSGKFGVQTVAIGNNSFLIVSIASGCNNGCPPLAIITGSTINGPKFTFL